MKIIFSLIMIASSCFADISLSLTDIKDCQYRPIHVALSPRGKHLCVINSTSKSITNFRLNTHKGIATYSLDNVISSSNATVGTPVALQFSKSNFLYCLQHTPSFITTYKSNEDNETLQQHVTVGLPYQPCSLALHPNDALIAVTYTDANKVGLYRVDPQTGTISINQDSSQLYDTQEQPNHCIFSPDGRFLAVTNTSSHTITLYHVDTQGAMLRYTQRTLELSSIPSIHALPLSTVFSPDSKYLAYITHSKSLFVYNLSEEMENADHLPYGPHMLTYIPSGICYNPSGNILFTCSMEGITTLSGFSINPNTGAPERRVDQIFDQFRNDTDMPNTIITPDGKFIIMPLPSRNQIVIFKPISETANGIPGKESCEVQ